MKYIVIKNENVQCDELLYDIADFFWNNGNEVLVKDDNKNDHQDAVEDFDFVVLLVNGERSEKYFFERDLEVLYKDFELDKSYRTKTILVFSKNGVFSNMIPFPHKLFHFDNLNQDELVRFFSWCHRFNMFTKKERDRPFYNILNGL
jgi:hypothetical protein